MAERVRQPHPAAVVDDERLGVRGRGIPLLGEAAVADAHNPVGDPRGPRVVGHQHECGAQVADRGRQHVVDEVGGSGVELAGGLVGEHDRGTVRERGGDRDALRLATREGLGAPTREVAETEAVEGLAARRPRLLARASGDA